MTFTLSPRHFPNRSGWRNGVYRLSWHYPPNP